MNSFPAVRQRCTNHTFKRRLCARFDAVSHLPARWATAARLDTRRSDAVRLGPASFRIQRPDQPPKGPLWVLSSQGCSSGMTQNQCMWRVCKEMPAGSNTEPETSIVHQSVWVFHRKLEHHHSAEEKKKQKKTYLTQQGKTLSACALIPERSASNSVCEAHGCLFSFYADLAISREQTCWWAGHCMANLSKRLIQAPHFHCAAFSFSLLRQGFKSTHNILMQQQMKNSTKNHLITKAAVSHTYCIF